MKDFMNELVVRVQLEMGMDVEVSNQEIEKNNGEKKYAVVVRTKENNAAPCIYVDEDYERFQEGEIEMEEIVQRICKTARDNQLNLPVKLLSNWKFAQENLFYKVINTTKNQQMLQDCPHHTVEGLDLSVIYYFELGENKNMMVRVTDDMLQRWALTEEELFRVAEENTKRKSKGICMSMIRAMQDILSTMSEEEMPEELREEIPESDDGMYLLTNEDRRWGARCILETELLEKLEETIGSFYILPSSVHELILVPCDGVDPVELKAMVMEINETQVAPEERLSDYVYTFDSECQKVVIAA